MPENPKATNIEEIYRAALSLWLAMLMSQFMFFVLIYFAKPGLFNLDALTEFPKEIDLVILALGFVGLMTFALSFVVKAKFIKSAVEKQQPTLVQQAQIVAYALCEATSLFGLITAFAFEFRYFFLWIFVGLLGFLLHFPRRDNFHAASYKGKI
jgi:F0F1-type ATP synthase membrane subunit c/vacuolar-type H+-ATPase subunit K